MVSTFIIYEIILLCIYELEKDMEINGKKFNQNYSNKIFFLYIKK